MPTSTVLEAIPYGERLMPCILSETAELSPNRPYAAYPSNPEDGTSPLKTVTFRDTDRAVDALAHWIVEHLGHGSDFETLTFIGVQDIRSALIFFAAVKCGFKLLLPSPRNATDTNIDLMRQTNSLRLLFTSETEPLARELATSKLMSLYEIPSLDWLLNARPKPFTYQPSYNQAKDHPIVVLHSSGSTGRPKPIVMTHASFASLDSEVLLPSISGRKNRNFSLWNELEGSRYYTAFPYCHLAGFTALIPQPLFTNSVPVLGPARLPPTGPLLASMLTFYDLSALFVPPSLLEQLCADQSWFELLQPLRFIVYIGGPLSPAIGNEIARIVPLRQLYGSTETLTIPLLEPKDPVTDWAYLSFHPKARATPGLVSAPSASGLSELVLHPGPGAAVLANVPNLKTPTHRGKDIVWRTKDLFAAHPKMNGLWLYAGRVDDIIVLSSGEKVQPVEMELAIVGGSRGILSGALIIGSGRRRVGLLMEVTEGLQMSTGEVIQSLWPIVETANDKAPNQGRIHKDRVRVVGLEDKKRFLRAAKGTVIRRMTEEFFKDEVDGIYKDLSVKSNL